eukprot:12724478-Ditylum_brightwellii.AAC.1
MHRSVGWPPRGKSKKASIFDGSSTTTTRAKIKALATKFQVLDKTHSEKQCGRVLADWPCVVIAQATFVCADMNYHEKWPISGPVYCAGKQWDAEDEINSATVKDVKWNHEMGDENEEDGIENRKSKDPLPVE